MPKPPKEITMPVSLKALFARVERALRKQQQRLWADRRGGWLLIDTAKERIIATNVNVIILARQLKVMRPWERLED